MANVTGDFNTAATWVENATYMVIAVGHPADLAPFWNPCGWNTTAYSMTSYPACHTPFDYYSVPYDGSPVAGLFESADGITARDSLQLAMMLGHYAIYGDYPPYLSTLPADRTLSGQTYSTSDCTGTSTNGCPSNSNFSCTTSACGTDYTAQQFYTLYGPFAEWASHALQLPLALILTEWYEESGKGSKDICTPYNNPANIYGSGPAHPFDNICDGVYQGYIAAFSDTSIFPVSASDGNGRTAAQYISDAYHNGYTIPSSNGYGPIQGAGTYFAPGFEAACAAMGAMGWAQSNYWVSGDSPNTAGTILMNWYNTYFSGMVSTSTMSNASKPSCCGTTG